MKNFMYIAILFLSFAFTFNYKSSVINLEEKTVRLYVNTVGTKGTDVIIKYKGTKKPRNWTHKNVYVSVPKNNIEWIKVIHHGKGILKVYDLEKEVFFSGKRKQLLYFK